MDSAVQAGAADLSKTLALECAEEEGSVEHKDKKQRTAAK